MKIVSPIAPITPVTPALSAPANGCAFLQNTVVDDQLMHNRNCSSTSTNSSCNSFSGSCLNNSLNVSDCNSADTSIVKKEGGPIMDNLYDDMSYQPNYYTNNSSYQLPEQNYLSNNPSSMTSYYA